MPVFSNNAGGGGGGGGAVVTAIFNCPIAVTVGDAVYVMLGPPNTVDRANAAIPPAQTPDAIGVVQSKPTPVTCVVVMNGVVTVAPPMPPLVQGTTYYVNTLLGPAPSMVPVAPVVKGEKIQEMGIAVNATDLYVYADPTSVIL